MRILDYVISLFRKRKRVVVNLRPEDLEDREINQTILNENAYLKGILTKIKVDEEKKRESKKDLEEEENIKKSLHQQMIELSRKELNPFSFKKLFKNKLFKKKKIFLTTFDGSKEVGVIEDIVLMPDGALGVVTGGKVLWASRDINNVFYWVAGLSNFAKNKIMPLCVNSKGEFTPNLQKEEVSDLIRDSDGKFKIFNYSKKPLYEMIADKNSEIQEMSSELENTESTIVEHQKEIKEAKREATIHKVRAEKSESDLSLALNKVSEMEMAQGLITKQNMALTQYKQVAEKVISGLEDSLEEALEKSKKRGSKTIEELNLEKIQTLLVWARDNIPEKQIIMPEKQEKPGLSELNKPVKV